MDLWDDRVAIARACRVMAHRGLAADVLGHVSLRVGPDRALLRCRGPHERGLRFTGPSDVRLVDLDGCIVDGGDGDGYVPPSEWPIHLATLQRHPVTHAVVHAHPQAVVVAGLAELPLVPMFGSYDIPAARLAAGGIPVFPRSVLIRDAGLAAAMLDAMGDRPVCLLRGHGLVATGATAAEAVLHALAADRLCRVAVDVVAAGGAVRPIPDDDLAGLPDLGPAFNVDTSWRHHLACLAADGFDIPPRDRRPDPEER